MFRWIGIFGMDQNVIREGREIFRIRMSSVEEENTAKSKTGGNAMSKADVIEVEEALSLKNCQMQCSRLSWKINMWYWHISVVS